MGFKKQNQTKDKEMTQRKGKVGMDQKRPRDRKGEVYKNPKKSFITPTFTRSPKIIDL